MARFTLYSVKNGFFGRTYQSAQTVLDSTTLKPVGDKMNEYVMFYSKVRDSDLHTIVEFILIIKEKSAPAPASATNVNASQEEEKKEESKKEEEKKDASQPIQSQAS